MEKQSIFMHRLNSTNHASRQYCSTDVTAGRWLRIWNMNRRIQAFVNKCYRRMLGIPNIDHKTNEYVWQQDVRNFYCQPSSVASYHDSAMSVVTIRCQKPYYIGIIDSSSRLGRRRKSWRGNIIEWTGKSLLSLLHIADNRSRWATITAETSVRCRSTPNDAWASLE